MERADREKMYLYLSALLVIFPTGYGVSLIHGVIAGISSLFVAGGCLLFFQTILNLKIGELTLTLEQIEENEE